MVDEKDKNQNSVTVNDILDDQRQVTDDILKNQDQQQNQDINSKKSQKNVTHHILNYRADIDGLRTVAIGIVVIFHAWPFFMTGGFIGVDIFFVISGYLISNIIIKQTKKNKFSYVDFYSRRIKRIYPALSIVLIFVLFVGIKKLLRRPLQIMTSTLTAATIFGANIQILTAEHDYFDPESTTNPVLHLWSLGVEEQFYIFWPLLLYVVLNKFQKKALHILTTYTAISFTLSIICVFKNSQFAFYFPFCRFWQMSVGGLVAYLNLKIQNTIINNILSTVSIVAIMVAVWIIDENSLFPGFWALIPTLGAACIIQAGKQSFINKHILSSKPFVFLGKISYSLYLWHWPLLVFSRILYPEGSKSIFAKPEVMVLIAVILSIVSYYLVENPFRKKKGKIVVIILMVVMSLILISSVFSYLNAQQFQIRRFNELRIQMLDKYLFEIQPTQQDFYVKNGRKIPNVSKNRNRQPTTVDKLKISTRQHQQKDRYTELLLSQKIGPSSKFFRPEWQTAHHYQVSNQGRDKLLFIIGDSHARFTTYRFQKLYEDSVAKGKQQEFPTVVSIVRQSSTFLPTNPAYDLIMGALREFRPNRLLLVYRWTNKWDLKQQRYWDRYVPPEERLQNLQNALNEFQVTIRELQSLGIQVYFTALTPQHPQYNPKRMKDQNGVIPQNITPIRYSEFHKNYEKYFELIQKAAKDLNVTMVDLTDNLCYDDICQVLTPKGYVVNFDQNHQIREVSKYWFGSIDFLTQF